MGVFKRGKTWWITYTDEGGERHQKSAKTTRKAEAQALFEGARSAIREGRFYPEKCTKGLTVEGLRDAWLKHAESKQKKSIADDRRRFLLIVWRNLDNVPCSAAGALYCFEQ